MSSDTDKSATLHTPSPILLISDTITIRPYCLSDAPTLAQYGNNIKIWRNLTDRFPHPYTVADATWWINHCADQSQWLSTTRPRGSAAAKLGSHDTAPTEDAHKDNLIPSNYTICHQNVAVGTISLETDPKNPFSLALGYWLAEPFWGKGIATLAATAFSNWAFDTFPWLARLDGDAYSWNQGSQKVLRKAGFVDEGIQRLKVCKEGKFGDLVLFGKVREGWTPDLMETKEP